MLVQAALVTDGGGCNMTRITKQTTKEINYYTITHNMQEYWVEETRNGARIDYEIRKQLSNNERTEILTLLRNAQKMEKKENERKQLLK